MKMAAIVREHSDSNAIAFATNPPLTPQVFEEFLRRVRTPAMRALSFEMAASCLRCNPESFTPELRVEIEQLLTEAEDVLRGAAARKQAEIEESEKQITL